MEIKNIIAILSLIFLGLGLVLKSGILLVIMFSMFGLWTVVDLYQNYIEKWR